LLFRFRERHLSVARLGSKYVGINDSILTEDLSTISEGTRTVLIDSASELKGTLQSSALYHQLNGSLCIAEQEL